MSTTHESSASLAAAPRPSVFWRVLFPLIVVIFGAGIFTAPKAIESLGMDTDAAVQFLMFVPPLLLLCVLLLGVWWLFLSGLRWVTKLTGVALVAFAVAGFYYSLRKVELTSTPTGLTPIFHFVWEPTRHDRRQEYQVAVKDEPDGTVGPEDFASYRGPARDGVVPHAMLDADWQANKPKSLWSRPCAGGYSGVAVAGNLVVTLEQHGPKEVVACYDRANGAERWTYVYDAYHADVMGDGPRSTPIIHDGRIFTLGATGELLCLNIHGKKEWGVNILDDSKAKNIKWGMTGSPLIVGDLVIAHAGIDPDNPAGAALVAFDQSTGKKRWAVGNRRAGYSSPQLVTLGKTPQILLFDGEGLVSYDLATQKELWSFPWVTAFEMNSIQPVILGDDRVFISSELDNGCAMLRVTPPKDTSAWSVEVVWKNKKLAARFANPVTDGKRIFALHGMAGQLKCLNADDGSLVWREGERYGPGQMLLAGNHLLIVSDKGVVSLMDKNAAEATELARHVLLNPKTKTWNTPALAGDQLFVRNQAEIACLKLPLRR